MKADNHDWLTVKQVADYLQVSIYTVYELIRQQQIPATKVGKRLIRVPRDEFMAALRAGVVHLPRPKQQPQAQVGLRLIKTSPLSQT